LERWRILVAAFCKLLGDSLGYLGPLLLNEMVRWATAISNDDHTFVPLVTWFGDYYGYALAGAMFLSIFFSNFMLQTHHHVRRKLSIPSFDAFVMISWLFEQGYMFELFLR
jgi:hypothetical protein